MNNPYRTLLAVRGSLWFVAGLAITFTAALHTTAFTALAWAITVVVISSADLVVTLVLRIRPNRFRSIVGFAISIIMAGVAVANANNLAIVSISVAIWAAANAVLELTTAMQSRLPGFDRELKLSAVLLGALAIVLVLVDGTPVSVLGLFGGYAFIVGVDSAIAAADTASTREYESEQ